MKAQINRERASFNTEALLSYESKEDFFNDFKDTLVNGEVCTEENVEEYLTSVWDEAHAEVSNETADEVKEVEEIKSKRVKKVVIPTIEPVNETSTTTIDVKSETPTEETKDTTEITN